MRLTQELRVISLVVFKFCASFDKPKLLKHLFLKGISVHCLEMKTIVALNNYLTVRFETGLWDSLHSSFLYDHFRKWLHK